MKYLTMPVKGSRIKEELMALTWLRNGPNVVQLLDVIHHPKLKIDILIFEFVSQKSAYLDLYESFNDWEARFYLFQVLKGLDFAHSMGLIHRDVKPGNIVYDKQRMKVRLCDWGLATFYFPNSSTKAVAGLKQAKAPEMIFLKLDYNYKIDMWLFGLTMASLLFQEKYPLFRAKEDEKILKNMIRVLGSKGAKDFIRKYRLEKKLSSKRRNLLNLVNSTEVSRKEWTSFLTEYNSHLCSPEAFDLLNHLLTWDYENRFSARQAMEHSYFDPIRNCFDEIIDPVWPSDVHILSSAEVDLEDSMFSPGDKSLEI